MRYCHCLNKIELNRDTANICRGRRTLQDLRGTGHFYDSPNIVLRSTKRNSFASLYSLREYIQFVNYKNTF